MRVAVATERLFSNVKHSLFAVLRSQGLSVVGGGGVMKKNQCLESKAVCVCVKTIVPVSQAAAL